MLSTVTQRSFSTMSASIPHGAARFLKYVDSSPTPFHATAVSADMLQKAGFQRLKEAESWQGQIEAGGKYLYVVHHITASRVSILAFLTGSDVHSFTRNQSAIVAFAVGHQFRPGGGVHVVGAHVSTMASDEAGEIVAMVLSEFLPVDGFAKLPHQARLETHQRRLPAML